MGTKQNPGDYDCYAKAEFDEPMFVLLARDPRAPGLVEAWADGEPEGGAKEAEALNVAEAMRQWRDERKPEFAENEVGYVLGVLGTLESALRVVASKPGDFDGAWTLIGRLVRDVRRWLDYRAPVIVKGDIADCVGIVPSACSAARAATERLLEKKAGVDAQGDAEEPKPLTAAQEARAREAAFSMIKSVDDAKTALCIGAIDLLCETAHRDVRARGFYDDVNEDDPRHDLSIMSLISSEVSECVEAIRNPEELAGHLDQEVFTALEEELADVVIRVFDYAGYRGIKLGRAIIEKLDYNRTRPYRHGGKKA